MVVTARIVLKPNRSQENQFKQFSGARRFTWNTCLQYCNEIYERYDRHPNQQEMIDYIRDLKYNNTNFSWLQGIPEAITKQAIKDLSNAFKNFFAGSKGYPKFKSRRFSNGFYQRTDNFYIVDSRHVKITGIKQPVKTGKNGMYLLSYFDNYLNPRIKYDGKYWYLTVSGNIDFDDNDIKTVQTLGVDFNIKTGIVCSDGITYPNINYESRILKLEKREKKLQRILSRKYMANNKNNKDNKYKKSNNIIKLENKIARIRRQLRYIRDNYLHLISLQIVSRAKNICIEDLAVSNLLKNKHLSKAIQDQQFYKLRQYIQYKAEIYSSNVKVADRWCPSSKRCSKCGNIKQDLRLSDRNYVCNVCGLSIDRDYNASLNLQALLT